MNCIICNSFFIKKVHNQKICSSDCVKKYRSDWMNKDYKQKMNFRKMIKIKCVTCDKIFEVKKIKGRKKTCSKICSKKMNSLRIRLWSLQKKYNITKTDYLKKLEEQNFKCQICNKNQKDAYNGLYVDHNHQNDKVRGLLCKECNVGIGFFKEDVKILTNAIKYLEKYKGI